MKFILLMSKKVLMSHFFTQVPTFCTSCYTVSGCSVIWTSVQNTVLCSSVHVISWNQFIWFIKNSLSLVSNLQYFYHSEIHPVR